MTHYYWADKKTTRKKQAEDESPPQQPILLFAGGDDSPISNPVEHFDNNIFFYGEVNEESAKTLNKVLRSMDKELQVANIRFGVTPPIKLYINSPGGSIFAGFSVVDTIATLKTEVHTYIDGSAASAATLISLVGTKRFAHENSFMLLHQLSSSMWGKYEDFKDEMQNLDLLMERIEKIYLKYTKIPKRDLQEILKHDLWFEADKCLEYGLVDKIV